MKVAITFSQQGEHPRPQHVARAPPLLAVLGVGERVVPAAQRDALHLEAAALQGEDLAPDEAVAHLRVLVDEIRDADHLYSIRRGAAPA